MDTPGAEPELTVRRLARPRVVLGWLFVIFLAALGVYALAPWVLPVRIIEGPLVQLTTPTSITLVWYTTRAAATSVELTRENGATEFPATSTGRRASVTLTGLQAGHEYRYRIRAGRRTLTRELTFEPTRPPDESFAFIVFGDSGMGNRVQYALAAEMAAALPPADFLLHTGDLIYPDGARRLYQERFFDPYRRMIDHVNFWPCLGNHDIDREQHGAAPAYCEVFELPGNGPPGEPADHHYWFDYGPARFAVFDSNLDEETLRTRVAPWLDQVMRASQPRWRFVVCHHPPYTGGAYSCDVAVQRHIVPVLEATGVDLMFNGHDHGYQRSYPLHGGAIAPPGQGVVYVVTGAGGARLYSPEVPRPEFIAAIHTDRHSFTHVVIGDDTLTLRQIATGGEVLDQWTCTKAPASTATAPATLPASQPANP